MRSNKQIAKIFRDFADNVENNTCGLDRETIEDIATKLIHVKLYSEDMCTYLGCSRATLTRMHQDGRIPKARKEAGGKEYWYKDEVEDYIYSHKK